MGSVLGGFLVNCSQGLGSNVVPPQGVILSGRVGVPAPAKDPWDDDQDQAGAGDDAVVPAVIMMFSQPWL